MWISVEDKKVVDQPDEPDKSMDIIRFYFWKIEKCFVAIRV